MLAAHQVASLLPIGPSLQFCQVFATAQVFADGDEFHLGRDDALAGIVHLRDVLAGLGAARLAVQVEAQFGQCRVVQALDAVGGAEAGQLFGVAALGDPGGAHAGQAGADVDLGVRVGVRAGGVVDVDRRIGLRNRMRLAVSDWLIWRIGTRMSGREPSM